MALGRGLGVQECRLPAGRNVGLIFFVQGAVSTEVSIYIYKCMQCIYIHIYRYRIIHIYLYVSPILCIYVCNAGALKKQNTATGRKRVLPEPSRRAQASKSPLSEEKKSIWVVLKKNGSLFGFLL